MCVCVCVCVLGVALLFLSKKNIKYPMKMKKFGLTETKLFHFNGIFKNGGRGSSEPHLDPPLRSHQLEWSVCVLSVVGGIFFIF